MGDVGRLKKMGYGFPESDWKIFRALREVALERFCKRVLAEMESLRTDALRTNHERYLDIWQLMSERDNELALAFNDPKRSQMIRQLIAMHTYGLLEQSDLDKLSQGTRDTIEMIVGQKH